MAKRYNGNAVGKESNCGPVCHIIDTKDCTSVVLSS
jgi:hypothetical protein